jgi:thiol-disulfide isomerase/thioredoxin
MNNQIKIFILIIGLLVLGTIATVVVQSSGTSVPSGPGKYDAFAQCLKDKGAVFYGAFWCPHCQAQKKAFGSSAKLLPYVECSTADANGQTQICIDKKIQSYPTWELADGTRIPDDSPDGAGVKLETLAAKTGCILPQ